MEKLQRTLMYLLVFKGSLTCIIFSKNFILLKLSVLVTSVTVASYYSWHHASSDSSSSCPNFYHPKDHYMRNGLLMPTSPNLFSQHPVLQWSSHWLPKMNMKSYLIVNVQNQWTQVKKITVGMIAYRKLCKEAVNITYTGKGLKRTTLLVMTDF